MKLVGDSFVRLAVNAALGVGLAALAVSDAGACPPGLKVDLLRPQHVNPMRLRGFGPYVSATIVTLGRATIVGELDAGVVRRQLGRRQGELAACAFGDPLRATVRFRITPTGMTTNVSVTGLEAPVATCVAAVIDDIAFSKLDEGEVLVSIPLEFGAARP